jgi:hypothetical protein
MERRRLAGFESGFAAEEQALEPGDDLLARERRHAAGAAVLLEHAHVVLERTVRGLERVVELVPLEEVSSRAGSWLDGAAG